jgi:predicted nucleic acid-binding protein
VKRLVVADTTVWSNFAHAGDPRLVQAAFPSVSSPPAVVEELDRGHRLGYVSWADWAFIEGLALTEKEASRAMELEERLGAGEAACLAVGEARGGLVLTDDRAARKTARLLGVRLSGTLGVLARLVDAGRLSVVEADQLLGAMLRSGYRSPVSSISELL